MKKSLKRIKLIVLVLLALITVQVFAFVYSGKDITPPTGSVTVTGVTPVDGKYNVENKHIQLTVNASDDVSDSSDIKMYISTTPINQSTKIEESAWENYSTTKTVRIPSISDEYTIYVAFKDAAGNVSKIFEPSYTVTYNANGGTKTPNSQKASFGEPFTVTSERPQNAGKYFLGWSTSKTGSVEYTQGEVIPAEKITGNFTLYAKWGATIDELPLLKDKVKVGDYINYPVAYNNVASYQNANTSSKTGWRVLSIDADGTVNIVSAGVPMTYKQSGTASTSVTNLTTNFLTTNFTTSTNNTYIKKGFQANASLKEIFTNKYTKLSGSNPVVRAMTLDDIKAATGKTSITGTTDLSGAQYEELFATGGYTHVATAGSSNLWYINSTGSLTNAGLAAELGLRVVVSLKPTTTTAGRDTKGGWTIEYPDEIQVTFMPECTEHSEQTKIVTLGQAYGTLPTLTRTGYTFYGWYTAKTGGTKVTSSTIVTNPSNHKLYAIWNADEYTITYDLDGGTVSGNPTKYTIESAAITLKNPTKTGYTFTGWTGSNGTTKQTTVTIPAGSTGNKSYTANWEANEYTYNIVYKSSKEELGTAKITAKFDETKTITPIDITGYTKPASQDIKWDSVTAKTITFIYTPIEYTITYDLDGGTVSPENPTKYTIETETFTLNNPTKTGYTFAGWTGTGLSGATKTVTIAKGSTGNKSYKATYSANSYTYNIIYKSSTGTNLGDDTVTAKFGSTQTIEPITIAGYNKPASQDVEWDSTTAKTITFTYPIITYTIKYNLNGGTVSPANPTSYNVETPTFTLNNPTLTGNTFAGWTGTGLSAATKTVTITKGSTGNREYTATYTVNSYTYNIEYVSTSGIKLGSATKKAAFGSTQTITPIDITGYTKPSSQDVKWDVAGTKTITFTYTPIQYTITYDLDGGTVTGNPTSYTIESAAITLKNPSKTGYTFAGWTGSNGETKQTSVTIAAKSTGNKSYTANYSTVSYTITYDLDGGTVTGNPSSYTIETATFTLKNPTKTGYTFAGWTGTGLSGATKTVSIAKGSTGNREYTATWTPVSYTITYDLDGGTVSGTNPTSYTIESNAITLINPTRTGYTFAGWTGTGLSSATKTVTIATGSTGNRSYKATWTPIEYTISYTLNGGSVSGNPSSYTIETATFTLKNPTRTGYTFAGWTGTGLSSATKTVTIEEGSTGDRKYTATWTANSVAYTVKHYQQNITDDNYTLKDTEDLKGLADSSVTPTLKSYTGFTAPATQTVKIAADGSTVVNYYYTRNMVYLDIAGLVDGTSKVDMIGYGTVDVYVNGTKVATGVGDYWTKHRYGSSYEMKNLQVTTGYTYTGLDMGSLTGTVGADTTIVRFNFTTNSYTISYTMNSGTNSSSNPTSYNVASSNITLVEPTRTGYEFAGWTETVTIPNWYDGFINFDTGAVESYNSTYPNSVYSERIYLQAGVTYTISGTSLGDIRWRVYNTSGTYTGSISGATYTPTSDCHASILLYEGCTAANRTAMKVIATYGVTGLTWNSGFLNISTGAVELNNSTYPNSVYSEPIFLKGGVTHTITGTSLGGVRWRTYNLDGTFQANASSETSYTPTADCFVRILLYEGCTEANRNAAVVTSRANQSITIKTGSTGNRTYEAKWMAKSVSVKFMRNHSSSDTTSATQVFTYGKTSQSFSAKGWTRTGYTAQGWAHTASATSTNYAVLSGVTDNWINSNSPMTTLYMVWGVNTYSISYDFTSDSLPSGYTPLRYIESTGTQYINTGITENAAYGIKMNFQVTGTAGDWQSLLSGTLDNFTVGTRSTDTTGFYIRLRTAEVYNTGGVLAADGNELIIKNGDVHLNGNKMATYTHGALSTGTGSMYIFANNALSRYGKMRLYGLELYNSAGNLSRNFIPCKNSSGTIGLYDTVGSKFYANSGSGTFTAGPALTIPSGYKQLSYIQSTGTQYIDTGYNPTNATRVIMEFQQVDTTFGALYGGRTNTAEAVFGTWIEGGKLYPHYGNISYNNYPISTTTTNKFIYEQNAGYASVVGGNASNSPSASFTSSYSLTLLTMHDSTGYDTRCARGKLYSAKIYNGTTLVRDFVPCINSSNAVGLYDLVGGKFYANAGTGTFTASETYPTSYTIVTTATLPTPSRSGYTFAGWTGSNGTTPQTTVTIATGNTGNKSYKANWTPIDYSISYTSELPTGYTELAYIQSTGTQWIDSGVPIGGNTWVNTDLMFDSAFNYNMMFGAWADLSVSLRAANTVCAAVGGAQSQNIGSTTTTGVRYNIILGPGKGYVQNGVTTALGGASNAGSGRNILLFAASNSGNTPYAWTSYGVGKIYSFKIYNGTTGNAANSILVRNFIPCKSPSNVLGLYDTVESKFYANQGTGTFTAGSTVRGALPAEYTELEYIESTGTQWIDTGFTPNQDTRVVMDFDLGGVTSTGWATLFAARDNACNNGFGIYQNQALTQIHETYSGQASYTGNLTGRHLIDKNKNITSVDGTVVKTHTYATYTAPVSMRLLYDNQPDGGDKHPGVGKLYSCQIYNNGTLARNFVPAMNSSGTVGLYDTVNGVFYTNKGTGTFKSSALPAGYTELEYLESTGTQYINTGFTPNANTRILVKASETGTYSIYGAGAGYSNVTGNANGMYFYYDGYDTSGGQGASVITNLYNAIHIFDQNKNVCYVDGKLYHTFNQNASYTAPATLFLFGRNNNSGALGDAGGTVRIYYAQIYDNGTLVRDYVPAVNSSGVAGLYDRANGTFYTNAGSGSFVQGTKFVTSYTTKDAPITLPTPSKDNCTFIGWTGANGTTPQTSVTIPAGSLGNKSYSANWKMNAATYTVKHYQENVADTNYTLKETQTYTDNVGASVTPAVKSYTGFTAPSTQTVTVAADGSTVVSYYYTRITYYLDLNGMLDGTSSGNISGYGTADVYVNGSKVATGATDYWTAWKYGSTYEIKNIVATTGHVYNGVNSGALSGTITAATNVRLTFSTATYTNTINHIVYGGNSSAGTYREIVFATSTFTAAYGSTITFDGSHKTTIPNGTYVSHYGTDAFAGSWKAYWVKDSSTATQPANAVSMNLYYCATTYTVTYNLNSGTNASSNKTSYTVMDGFTLANPTRSGYEFKGWTNASGATVTTLNGGLSNDVAGDQVISNFASRTTGNQTLTANWGVINSIAHWTWGYTNQEGNNGNKQAYHLTNTTFSAIEGSTFTLGTGNATTIPNGFALRSTFGTSSVTGSWVNYNMGTTITQTASAMGFEYDYDPITYSITYNMNGGTNNASNPSTYNVLYGVTLQNPTRTGYTFTGWTNASGAAVTGINAGANATFSSASDLYSKLSSRTTGNQTLTANWTPNKIKITLNANGGSGGTSAFWYYYGTSTFYSDEACTTQITAITRPTRSGYLYVHYAGDGTSGGTNGERYVAYNNGSSNIEFASDLATDIYKDATLYASWVQAVTITYWKSAELNWAAASINKLTSATGPVTGNPTYLGTTVSPSSNVYGGTTSSLSWGDTYANESGRNEKSFLGITWSTTGVTGTSNKRTLTVPIGTTLTFTLNNHYYNGGDYQCAIYNTNSTTGCVWGPGQAKNIGTYTYTVNSNINVRANWKTAGEYIPGVTDIVSWIGGSDQDDRDSWWDVHIY